jgi:ADP-ribose pyrophosphatase YjhB (NUDIX family)
MADAPSPLPHDVFLHTFSLVPRVALNLQVRGPQGEILLTRRAPDMETMPGVWHYPGAYIWRMETLEACAARIAEKELGTAIQGTPRPFGFFQNLDADPRGHVIDLVVEVDLVGEPQITEETAEFRFFSVIPPDMPFHQDQIMRAAGLPDA